MCVLDGYIGDRPAAPILLDMLAKQEGLGGGYYTGLATIDDGRLHYRKVVGDVAALRAETDADSLPGTIGIAHSRTPSGGDVEWGHPFLSCDETMAYVAQGSMGVFKDRRDTKGIGDGLLSKGHVFRAVSNEKVGSYPVLSNGKAVHVSDIMCHLIGEERSGCGDLLEAMRRAYMRMPAEICGLTIHQDDPDRLIAATINQSVVIGRDASSTYLASVGLALPESVSWRMLLPMNTTAAITRDGMELRPFDPTAEPVDERCPYAEAESLVLQALREEPGQRFGKIAWGLTKSVWPDRGLVANSPMAYAIIERLYRAGRLRFETERVPGMFNQGTVPQVKMYLQE
jgi:glucosamine--fructose-6-phosphate aminotransferase (isomerizing)